MSVCARSESSTRKAMLPRKVVEELIGRSGSTGLHVLVPLPDAFDGLLIVLALPFEVFGKDIIKSIRGTLAAATGKILGLRQSLGVQRHRVHGFQQYPMSSLHQSAPSASTGCTMDARRAGT